MIFGPKQRTILLYGFTIFAAFVLILLLIDTVFTQQFYSLNLTDSDLVDRYQATFKGIGILFIPAGLFFALAIGWIISQELFPGNRSEIQLDAEADSLLEGEEGFQEKLHTVRDTIDNMQTAYEQIQAFSANASHELRTPLTIMRGEIELALRRTKKPEEYQELLGSMLEEILRLSRILDDLLLIAKTEVGEKPIELQPVNLKELVEDLADEAEMHAGQSGVTFILERVDEAIIDAEPLRIRRVLLNLVDNAVKYNRKNGKVTMSLKMENNLAVIRVKDTGIGIPEDAIPKLFERFYRVNDSGTQTVKGTGLGLFFVHWIIKNHGGSVDVKSTPGEGSEFIVRLPVRK